MNTKKKDKLQELTERRGSQILDAAGSVFARKGFAKAGTDEIARVAGLGKGTLYRYFKNKEDLFLSVVDRSLEGLKHKIRETTDGVEDPLEKIAAAARAYLSFFDEDRFLVDMLIHEQSGFRDRIEKKYYEHYYGSLDRIRATYKAAVDKGLLKKSIEIDDAISVMTSILQGTVHECHIQGKRYKLIDKLPLVLKVFFTGVVKDEKRRKYYDKM